MFDDSISLSSLSSIGRRGSIFGATDNGDKPCGWLMPVIIVIAVILGLVLLYYWFCPPQSSTSMLVIENYAGKTGSIPTTPTGQVADLNSATFEQKLKSEPQFAVAFVSNGCGWCTKLKPELIAAAKKSKIPVYTLYSHNAKDLLGRYKINGFPHILKFKNGKVVGEQPGFAPQDKLVVFLNQ